MYGTKALFFVAAFAGISLSQKSDAEYCSSKEAAFFSWAQSGPTTPAAVLSYIATVTPYVPPLTTFDPHGHQSEICRILNEIPPSLLPEFETYITSVLSFGQASSTVLLDYATDCEPEDKVASVTSYIYAMLTPTGNPCLTETATPGGSANGTYPTSPAPTATSYLASPSPNNATATYTTSVVTAAAAKPTGVLLGAAAMGGILGAVALL
ncbi:hypothetical protein F5Y03DRAFT_380581 [Xylaria venustula]|nr:hypothetical protein F5Y03DRAFT_380581 [Xylaria venustula]